MIIDERRIVRHCPFCGNDDLKDMDDDVLKRGAWFCKTCEEEFTIL